MRRVLAVEAERLDDSIAQSRRFLTDGVAEAFRHRALLVPPKGELEEHRQQPAPNSVPPSSPNGTACSHCQSPSRSGVTQALSIVRRMPARVNEPASGED